MNTFAKLFAATFVAFGSSFFAGEALGQTQSSSPNPYDQEFETNSGSSSSQQGGGSAEGWNFHSEEQERPNMGVSTSGSAGGDSDHDLSNGNGTSTVEVNNNGQERKFQFTSGSESTVDLPDEENRSEEMEVGAFGQSNRAVIEGRTDEDGNEVPDYQGSGNASSWNYNPGESPAFSSAGSSGSVVVDLGNEGSSSRSYTQEVTTTTGGNGDAGASINRSVQGSEPFQDVEMTTSYQGGASTVDPSQGGSAGFNIRVEDQRTLNTGGDTTVSETFRQNVSGGVETQVQGSGSSANADVFYQQAEDGSTETSIYTGTSAGPGENGSGSSGTSNARFNSQEIREQSEESNE